ncbi:alpha-1,3-mannosyl-glycoprotein 4-beta-N-acetylglucosaminyltransferase a [Rhynchophorus ferrugineus]|uniref:alpha-1,3-mannosyl-glycoprotein 4-beta-N-acetylglucosaminyltransferase a n=1 Tax=Rhynchophorus ferrugineus TaxID=354439 RepID=UPI003FCDF28A
MVVNLPASPLRRRNCFLILGFALFAPFCFFVLFSVPDVNSEQVLIQRLAELQIKLQYLDSVYRIRQEDLQKLTEYMDVISSSQTNSSATSLNPNADLKPDIKQLVRNMSGLNAANGVNPPVMLRFPSSYYFLPHLLDDPLSLRLAYLLSKGRTGVSLVMGLPTVKREKQNYLMDTLQNLIEGMNPSEANDTLIVVFVAETDLKYVLQVAREIEIRHPIHVESGLIEVIAPSHSYYPNLDKLRITLGDSRERVRWRSKQNLDFAFLMSYCQSKGTFYVQLEDDILAVPRYVTEMKNFALDKTAKKEPWFVLDFCQLGFIGKMFKSAELPWLISFFQMFYNDKPVDWLLDHLLYTKICNYEKNNDICKKEKAKLWIHYKPSLFQHVGTHSSLKGKMQRLKDKQFGKVALFFPHSNPEADVTSSIKHYKQYTLKRAYLGETFFWGLLPQPDDQLTFTFSSPIHVKRFHFRSGNADHPADKFYNTTVEVLPLLMPKNITKSSTNVTTDGFVIVGKFDHVGIASGVVDEMFGKIKAVRLHVHSDSENWAILSEIHIREESR